MSGREMWEEKDDLEPEVKPELVPEVGSLTDHGTALAKLDPALSIPTPSDHHTSASPYMAIFIKQRPLSISSKCLDIPPKFLDQAGLPFCLSESVHCHRAKRACDSNLGSCQERPQSTVRPDELVAASQKQDAKRPWICLMEARSSLSVFQDANCSPNRPKALLEFS